MTIQRLGEAAELLLSVASRFGGHEEQIKTAERVDHLTVEMRDVSPQALLALTHDDCSVLRELFGDSISLEIVADSLPLLTLSHATDVESIKRYHQDADKCASATVTVAVDKERLVAHFGLAQTNHRIVVFLFRSAFIQFLSHALRHPEELEEQLWRRSIDRSVVVVIDEDGLRMKGTFWSVLGFDQAERLDQLAPVLESEVQNANSVFAHCRESVRWDKPFLSKLVPSCFRVAGSHRQGSDVARLMMAHWANACVLFTADRIQVIKDKIVGTYATERSRCEISLFEGLPLGTSPSEVNVTALGDIAEWAYDEKWGSDRLRMVQINVSRSLAYGDQPRPVSSLVEQSHGLRNELEWHWKSFIAEEIDRFVEDERKLEDEVAQAVESFDSQVAEMIKSLSGAMLAAVGVLIGSVIAAAFKGSFNATVFSIGVWSYVGYLLLFPGLYNMAHHVLRFRAASDIFERRRSRFRRLLAPEVVNEISDTHVKKAKCRFWGWFWFTLLAFGGVVFACYLADQYIPSLLEP